MASQAPSRRKWLWLLAIPVLPLVIMALFAGVVLEILHPEPADPELQERDRRVLPVRTSAPPTRDSTGCTLEVTALQGTRPVADVELLVRPRELALAGWEATATTDKAGRAHFDTLPCMFVELEATHDELAGPGTRSFQLLPTQVHAELVRFHPPAELTGTVTDEEGEPIPDSTVLVNLRGELTTTTDSKGRWRIDIPVDPTLPPRLLLEADALGFYSETKLVGVHTSEQPTPATTAAVDVDQSFTDIMPGDQLRIDFTLLPRSEVRVWCAGLPEDRCNDMLVQCTHPLVPVGETCSRDPRSGDTICECPDDGRVAIRGGGKATLVDAGEQEAWLDFRDAGSISGDVLADGRPVSDCEVAAIRVPNGLEDLPRGFIAAQKSVCDDQGHFQITGLVDGDWELLVEASAADLGNRQRVLSPSRVRPRLNTDVGEVEILDGGSIEGQLVNGLTGEPESSGGIIAVRRGLGQERSTPAFANVKSEGHFTIEGLPPGEWELCHVLSPHVRTFVTVEDGAITDGVEVETSDATALDTNGFALRSAGDRLVVEEVEPGSPAEQAGLTSGDEVTGLLIAGLDLGGNLGESADQLMQLVLGHWDGPGITLIVERDGEEYEVELDW